MRVTGSGKSFIATAAVLMACLVIVTLLAINIRLQSALTSPGSTPRVQPGTLSSSAPTLQNTASPLVDIVSPSAPAATVPEGGLAPASEVSAPSAPSAAPAPQGNVAVSPSKTVVPGAAPPAVTAAAPPVPTPTSPQPSGVTATTTTTAHVSPAPSSDLGDATASTGEDGHHKANAGNLSPYVSASVPTPTGHGKGGRAEAYDNQD